MTPPSTFVSQVYETVSERDRDGQRARSLARRLDTRRNERWPELIKLAIRYHGNFAYLSGLTAGDDQPMPLCRLRYLGSPDQWGFAVYLASKDGYEDSILPTGSFTGVNGQVVVLGGGHRGSSLVANESPRGHAFLRVVRWVSR